MTKKTPSNNLATKNDLDALETRVDTKIDLKFDRFRDEVGQMFTNFRSDIFDKLDAFVKEVRDSHEERSILANQIAEVRDRVDDHNERIIKLEGTKIS